MKTIKTTKGTFILVEVPKGACEFHIKKRDDGIISLSYFIETRGFINLPAGNYELIGNPFELSDEQCEEIVDTAYNSHGEKGCSYYGDSDGTYDPAFITPKISISSLLRANEIYRENPFGEKPQRISYYVKDDTKRSDLWYLTDGSNNTIGYYDKIKFDSDLERWNEAQEKVSEWVILKVI